MTVLDQAPDPRLSRAQVVRLGRLLNMYYKPSEIADLLGVNVDTVRRTYLAAGCPHKRDKTGHIWIVGTDFKEWADDVIAKRKRKKTKPMAQNEAWCFKCKDRVQMSSPKLIAVNRYLEILQCPCRNCGTKVNRARARIVE